MPGAEQLAEKVNSYLVGWANENGFPDKSYLIECECPRFASGDGKGLIKSTIRGLDLFIVIDVGNYSIQYKMFDKVNCMSPDDHYQDLKRIIQAASFISDCSANQSFIMASRLAASKYAL